MHVRTRGVPTHRRRFRIPALPQYRGVDAVPTAHREESGAQVYRHRRVSNPIQRQQTKWVVFGFATSIGLVIVSSIVFFLVPMVVESRSLTATLLVIGRLINLLLPTAFAVALAIAVLHYRLFAIDLTLNRALVYGALPAFIVGMYVLSVGTFGALFQSGGNLVTSLLATAAIALLFQPLRERVQRTVNRLTYGERDDPYSVISRLGQRLESTLAPDAILPTIFETVAQALKLPYAAIELTAEDSGRRTTAQFPTSGVRRPSQVVRLPLIYQHEPIGELVVATRSGEEKFNDADRGLLETLADQGSIAAHAVGLTNDLQRSRERLVTAREEERRRIRRDLHDGLGPALASVTLKLDAAHNLLTRDPDAADALLTELKAQTQAAIADIRRLVYDLRPPALDELGLVSALSEHAVRYNSANGLRVTIDAPEKFPPLPAALEVAAYRIVQEALTNVVRHARAHRCVVRLSWKNALQLEITDDGIGFARGTRAGVGLTSMRERAGKLGGICEVEPVASGGTRVYARLPVNNDA